MPAGSFFSSVHFGDDSRLCLVIDPTDDPIIADADSIEGLIKLLAPGGTGCPFQIMNCP